MNTAFFRRATRPTLSALAVAALLAACGGGGDDDTAAPASPTPMVAAANQLYTQTNDSTNAIVQFNRGADGRLTRAASVPTGGTGTNGIRINGSSGPNTLGSQFSVVAVASERLLIAANGGDNSLSVFSLDTATGRPTLLRNTRTAGLRPNSLAVNGPVVYSSFLGGTLQLGAYRMAADGSLAQIGLYNVAQMSGLNPAQVAPTQILLSPDRRFLMVSPGTASNAVLSFPINADGTLGNPVANTTDLTTPFAGQFVRTTGGSTVYLSTGISGVSLTAYDLSSTGRLSQRSQAAATGVGAPCWLVVTPDGRYAYVGNGSGSISSYAIGADGTLTLLRAIAAEEPSVLMGVNSVAGDSWVSGDGRYLYSTYLGADKVVTYAIAADGSLSKIDDDAVGTASRLGLQGLAGT
ncbi:lactonase family protein [Aquabacterium humicola]|uniref:lactonase family protein n=1 Tax=Aquabacterium humicola TaxID=3237377 RepID=UPI002543DED5|nr:beta-propeller fold lactonase family protein [Rubrivivax pictus]